MFHRQRRSGSHRHAERLGHGLHGGTLRVHHQTLRTHLVRSLRAQRRILQLHDDNALVLTLVLGHRHHGAVRLVEEEDVAALHHRHGLVEDQRQLTVLQLHAIDDLLRLGVHHAKQRRSALLALREERVDVAHSREDGGVRSREA